MEPLEPTDFKSDAARFERLSREVRRIAEHLISLLPGLKVLSDRLHQAALATGDEDLKSRIRASLYSREAVEARLEGDPAAASDPEGGVVQQVVALVMAGALSVLTEDAGTDANEKLESGLERLEQHIQGRFRNPTDPAVADLANYHRALHQEVAEAIVWIARAIQSALLGLEAYVGPELGGQVQQQAAQALEAVEASRSVVDSARAEYVEIVRRDAEANRQAANLMERIAGLDEDWPEENEEETEDR